MTDAPVMFLPPGGLMEIIFSFDTTGSMSSILEEVQGRVQDMIQRLQADIPGIRIGVIAHGDYCDKDVFYLTKEINLTSNIADLCTFVKDVGGTGGGDVDECYELVLKMVREKFSWSSHSQKVLVMIGDANPHEPGYELNTDNIDWREEVDSLKDMGVKIYAVQALENEGVDEFYKSLAARTEGHYIKLGQLSNICDFLMAICYRERGDDLFAGYEAEVRSRPGQDGVNIHLDSMFGKLRKTDSNVSSSTGPSKLLSIPCPISPLPSQRVVKATNLKKLTTGRTAKNRRIKTTNKKHATGEALKSNMKTPTSLKTPTPLMLHREKVPHTTFTCRTLDWSTWRAAYKPVDNENVNKRFVNVNGGKCLRKIELFSRNTRKTAVYEIAVQIKKYGRRYIMYTKTIVGKIDNRNWEKNILNGGKQRLRKQIFDVVEKGCTVFVRRALVPKRKVSLLNNLRSYDYAWNKDRLTRQHRLLRKNDIVISGTSMEE